MIVFDAFIDPGKYDASIALFSIEGHLRGARMVALGSLVGSPFAGKPLPHLVAAAVRDWLRNASIEEDITIRRARIERMKVYQARGQKGDQEDVLDVQLTGGACGLVMLDFGCRDVQYVYAAEWKGQIPKPVTKRRVDAELSAFEKGCITWPYPRSKRHNVYDAIHGGLRTLTSRRA